MDGRVRVHMVCFILVAVTGPFCEITTTAESTTEVPGAADFLEDIYGPLGFRFFDITLAVETLDGVEAVYKAAYNDKSTTDYQQLNETICDSMSEAVEGSVSDCKINTVSSGSIIIQLHTIIWSSIITSDNVTEWILDYFESNQEVASINSEGVVVKEVESLQCQACGFFGFYSDNPEFTIFDNVLYDEDLEIYNSKDCVDGIRQFSSGCHKLPSDGREHQCIAYETVTRIEHAILRGFARGCISITPGDVTEIYGKDGITHINENVDNYSDKDIVDGDGFFRAFTCGSNDCPTSFTPCTNSSQVQCYNSPKCINLSQFCDKTQDCPGNEDEDITLCSATDGLKTAHIVGIAVGCLLAYLLA